MVAVTAPDAVPVERATHCEFLTPPVVGDFVGGVSEGPGWRTVWSGVYQGVRPSEHTGEPVHLFADGTIGLIPQRTFALPVEQFPDAPTPRVVTATFRFAVFGDATDDQIHQVAVNAGVQFEDAVTYDDDGGERHFATGRVRTHLDVRTADEDVITNQAVHDALAVIREQIDRHHGGAEDAISDDTLSLLSDLVEWSSHLPDVTTTDPRASDADPRED